MLIMINLSFCPTVMSSDLEIKVMYIAGADTNNTTVFIVVYDFSMSSIALLLLL